MAESNVLSCNRQTWAIGRVWYFFAQPKGGKRKITFFLGSGDNCRRYVVFLLSVVQCVLLCRVCVHTHTTHSIAWIILIPAVLSDGFLLVEETDVSFVCLLHCTRTVGLQVSGELCLSWSLKKRIGILKLKICTDNIWHYFTDRWETFCHFLLSVNFKRKLGKNKRKWGADLFFFKYFKSPQIAEIRINNKKKK